MSIFDVCSSTCIHEPKHDGPHSMQPFVHGQVMVARFNRAIGAERGQTPAIRAGILRARLIMEEAFETAEALVGGKVFDEVLEDMIDKWGERPPLSNPDLVEAIDGGCDLLFVTYGMFDALGVNARPYFDLVWQANMTKLTGPIDEHGKRGKPPGFVPPNEKIRELLIKDGWKP